jgi:hypothetical protein
LVLDRCVWGAPQSPRLSAKTQGGQIMSDAARRRRRWAALAVLAMVLSACASSGSTHVDVIGATTTATTTPAAPTTLSTTSTTVTESAIVATTSSTLAASPEGIAATLERYREDDLTNVLQIQVVNGSGRTIELTSLQLVWPGLSEQPPVTTPHAMSAGQIADLPVPAGDAICSDPPRLDERLPDSPALALATVSIEGGTPAALKIPITDTRHVLERVYVPACRVQSVAYNATVAFDTTWTDIELDGKAAVAGTLRLTRNKGNEPIVIDEITRTVLLQFRTAQPTSGPLLTLAAGQREATVPVVLTESGDCRPHAIAESKHTFFLPTSLRVGDVPVVIFVIPNAASQPQILTMINKFCGLE